MSGKLGDVTPLSLKLWRVARRMTQQRLARALGVTQQTVSAWELGRTSKGEPVAIPGDLENRLAKLGYNDQTSPSCREPETFYEKENP